MNDCCDVDAPCWIHSDFCTRCYINPADDALCRECADDLLAEEAVTRGKAGEWW